MRTVWAAYPNVGISLNFIQATSDHISAVKAASCLLDYYLAGLFQAFPDLRNSGLELYAAGAAYNGGPKRVRYGLRYFGLDWLHAPDYRKLAAKIKQTRTEGIEYQWLRRHRFHETFLCLNKIHAVRYCERIGRKQLRQMLKHLDVLPVPSRSWSSSVNHFPLKFFQRRTNGSI